MSLCARVHVRMCLCVFVCLSMCPCFGVSDQLVGDRNHGRQHLQLPDSRLAVERRLAFSIGAVCQLRELNE